jgi:hypothetical protein
MGLAAPFGFPQAYEDAARRAVLAEAVRVLEANGQGALLPEGYRLQGALLLRQAVPDGAQAEACFQQALAVARHQQARSYELRAAVSLSRLWQQQGQREEARALLAPVYDWFTQRLTRCMSLAGRLAVPPRGACCMARCKCLLCTRSHAMDNSVAVRHGTPTTAWIVTAKMRRVLALSHAQHPGALRSLVSAPACVAAAQTPAVAGERRGRHRTLVPRHCGLSRIGKTSER